MTSIHINNHQEYRFNFGTGLELVTSGEACDAGQMTKVKYFANFLFKVDAMVDTVRVGVTDHFVSGTLQFADGTEVASIVLPQNGLEKVDWSNDVNTQCLLNPDVPKAREHLANSIRLQFKGAPTKTMTIIDQLGTHIIDGTPVFCAGDRLIWPTGLDKTPEIKWEPLPNVRLATDSNCSEEQAAAGMVQIVSLSPDCGRVLFSQMLLYVMREAFVSAGIQPRVLVFLFGETGLKKTTYAAFQTQIYNRDEALVPPTRLDASIPAAIKLLYEKDDCVIVLDDLFPAHARDIHRQQEKTLLEITRVVGDGIEPARMRGGQVSRRPPKCGVLVTGEYYTGTGSDAARHLPIRMTEPIDNDKMTACQREPLMLSTFYSFFIEWYITNFNGVVDSIREWSAESRSSKTAMHARLQDTNLCLEAAYRLFLAYCAEKGFSQHIELLNECTSFRSQLGTIVQEQSARIVQNQHPAPNPTNYLALIRTMFRSNQFLLVEKAKLFDPDEHDGVIHGEYLCLRPKRLVERVRRIDRCANSDVILDSLKAQHALKTSKGGNTRQIYGCTGNYRFVSIPLYALRGEAR